MFPVICKIGPFSIFSYGLMLAIAFMVASWLGGIRAKKEGISPDIIFNLCFIGVVFGIVGARIFYVLENLKYYSRYPGEIIMLQNGGLSWFGGLILGSLSGVIYLIKSKISVYRALDIMAPYLALAQAIGRIGCLLNGCCFGKESVFGIYFPVQDAVLIPIQIYSSLLLLGIFIVLRNWQEKVHQTGEIFFAYLFLYSIKRFFVEFWRADNPPVYWGLTLFQLISIAIFFLAGYKLAMIRFKKGGKYV